MSIIEMQQPTAGKVGVGELSKTKRQEETEKTNDGVMQAPPEKQPRTDSLDLSKDAQRYLENNESEDSATASEAAAPPPPKGGAPMAQPPAAEGTDDGETDLLSSLTDNEESETDIVTESLGMAEGTESTDDSLDDLSTYTDLELKELYRSGKLTALEYNTEIESRTED